jgi:hypothetical protein
VAETSRVVEIRRGGSAIHVFYHSGGVCLLETLAGCFVNTLLYIEIDGIYSPVPILGHNIVLLEFPLHP